MIYIQVANFGTHPLCTDKPIQGITRPPMQIVNTSVAICFCLLYMFPFSSNLLETTQRLFHNRIKWNHMKCTMICISADGCFLWQA